MSTFPSDCNATEETRRFAPVPGLKLPSDCKTIEIIPPIAPVLKVASPLPSALSALKAGLTEAEAQEVVQEVMIAAAKKMPGFTYEPGKDSLKGWLLSVTRWKVADQFRKRERGGTAPPPVACDARPVLDNDDTARTATVERVPDPDSLALDAIWEDEWRENLLRAALERVKQTVNPAHYEMYHLHVVQGLTPVQTARALGVSTAAVYLAKHRVGRLLRKQLKLLEKSQAG